MSAPPNPDTVPRHQQVLDRLVVALRQIDEVIAIGTYGSTATSEWKPQSDIDVVAILNIIPPVESLRFFVDGIPVDLNLRSSDVSDRGIGGAEFVPPMIAFWDPGAVLATARTTGRSHNPNVNDVVRYRLFHDLQKVRQVADKVGRRVATCGVVDQVLHAWFQTRGKPFPGIVASVTELRAEDPVVLELLEQALLEDDTGLAALVDAAERATAPAGGVFGPGDVLAVSWGRPAVEDPPALFSPVLDLADRRRV